MLFNKGGGDTPLHHAAAAAAAVGGNCEIVLLLLDKGADVNAKNQVSYLFARLLSNWSICRAHRQLTWTALCLLRSLQKIELKDALALNLTNCIIS